MCGNAAKVLVCPHRGLSKDNHEEKFPPKLAAKRMNEFVKKESESVKRENESVKSDNEFVESDNEFVKSDAEFVKKDIEFEKKDIELYADDKSTDEVKLKDSTLSDGNERIPEKIRFYKKKTKNDPELAERKANRADLADLFAKDALGSAHRAHSSTEDVNIIRKQSVFSFFLNSDMYYIPIESLHFSTTFPSNK